MVVSRWYLVVSLYTYIYAAVDFINLAVILLYSDVVFINGHTILQYGAVLFINEDTIFRYGDTIFMYCFTMILNYL
jgi:hypothetical protein